MTPVPLRPETIVPSPAGGNGVATFTRPPVGRGPDEGDTDEADSDHVLPDHVRADHYGQYTVRYGQVRYGQIRYGQIRYGQRAQHGRVSTHRAGLVGPRQRPTGATSTASFPGLSSTDEC